MTSYTSAAQIAGHAATVAEIVTEATPEALNSALAEGGIAPERILAVHRETVVGMGVGDYQAQYRVLYWQ